MREYHEELEAERIEYEKWLARQEAEYEFEMMMERVAWGKPSVWLGVSRTP